MRAFDLFARAVDLAFSQPTVLVPWVLIALVDLGAGLSGVYPTRADLSVTNVPALVLFAMGFLVLLAWVSATTLLFLRQPGEPGRPQLVGALREGLRRTPSLLLLYFLLLVLVGAAVGLPGILVSLIAGVSPGTAVLLGFLLLGWFLFLAVRLALAEAENVLDELSPSEAMGAAWADSRRTFPPLLGLLILLWIVGFLLSLLGWIPGVGVVLSPLATAGSSYLLTAALGYGYLALRGEGPLPGMTPDG